MSRVLNRLSELLRPGEARTDAAPVETLTVDLALAAAGFGVFGAAIAAGGGALWHVVVAAKLAGVFLVAFVLCLAPLYSLARFFAVPAPFGRVVSVFAGHLALGGIFVAAGAGVFALLSRGDVDADGALAVGIIALAILGVLVCRARSPERWLTPLPATLAVCLFLGLVGQCAWAFRPYMDPHSPTLFQARLEWFAGQERRSLERWVVELAGEQRRR